MNLRPRFHLFTILLFLLLAIPGWLAVRALAESIVEQWVVRYAEKQVLYDKSRTLQPILREVALSRQLASSPFLRDWGRHPGDPELTRRALAELENYRQNFQDHSYFVALHRNGHYYHNDAANQYAGRELRYRLNPGAAKDAWYFNLIRQGRELHLNVNPDPELGVTKLWIDVLIRDGQQVLGIAGTGLDLASFLRDVVDEGVAGVTTFLVDHGGAIQLHRDPSLIDFGSISKKRGEGHTLELLFPQADDRLRVLAAMRELESRRQTVATSYVNVDGRRHLVGIAYIPEIDWYEISLFDLDVLLPFNQFTLILVVYALSLIAILLAFNLGLSRYVLRPIRRLGEAMDAVEAGAPLPEHFDRSATGEIRQLLRHFGDMANKVLQARHDLEDRVQSRTQELEELTKIDPLTGVYNRRGMSERIAAELERSRREGYRVGILWLDIDWFKAINDRHGHAVGDRALKVVAELIRLATRAYDVAARWGGDEFLILLSPADAETLDRLGERLCRMVADCRQVHDGCGEVVPLSASIGGYLAGDDEGVDSLLHHGDQALYSAKAAGRSAYRATR